MTVRILVGHVLSKLAELPDDSVHCAVTSPPYWGLRDYGIERQVWGGDPEHEHDWRDASWRPARWGAHDDDKIGDKQKTNSGAIGHRGEMRSQSICPCGAWCGSLGLEPDYRLYVEHMVEVFRAVRRVLRADGTLWLNLGDSYATGGGSIGRAQNSGGGDQGERVIRAGMIATQPNRMPQPGLKPKDLVGIPWRVALALQDDGWWLRQDIIWSKPNPMPESVTDRCTKAHEYLFLLSKSERYHYDQEAIMEPCSPATHARLLQDVQAQIGSERAHVGGKTNGTMKAVGRHLPGNKSHKGTTAYLDGDERHRTKAGLVDYDERQRKLAVAGSGIKNNESIDAALAIMPDKRNKRSVWEIATQPFSEAHFATFPPALVEPCILAGCPEGGTVLDPFFGAGTVGLVAERLGRDTIGCELNPEYAAMAHRRIEADRPERLQYAGDQRHSLTIKAPVKPTDAGPLFAALAAE